MYEQRVLVSAGLLLIRGEVVGRVVGIGRIASLSELEKSLTDPAVWELADSGGKHRLLGELCHAAGARHIVTHLLGARSLFDSERNTSIK